MSNYPCEAGNQPCEPRQHLVNLIQYLKLKMKVKNLKFKWFIGLCLEQNFLNHKPKAKLFSPVQWIILYALFLLHKSYDHLSIDHRTHHFLIFFLIVLIGWYELLFVPLLLRLLKQELFQGTKGLLPLPIILFGVSFSLY